MAISVLQNALIKMSIIVKHVAQTAVRIAVMVSMPIQVVDYALNVPQNLQPAILVPQPTALAVYPDSTIQLHSTTVYPA